MKALTDYPTPETDAALVSREGHKLAFIEPDFARSLEQRLVLAREALAKALPMVESENSRFDSCCPDEKLQEIQSAYAATAPKL